MRILIAIERFHEDMRGGSYRVAADCAYELRDRGHQVTLLCTGLPNAPSAEVFDDIRILRYQLGSGPTPQQRHIRRMLALLNSEPAPDLVWGHTPFQFLAATTAFPSAHAAYVSHSPLPLEILNAHSPPTITDRLKARLGTPIERRCLQRAEVIQTLSSFTRSTLLLLHGDRFAEKIAVTPGWADTDFFIPADDRLALKRQLGWRTDVPCLFSLRRLVPRMGIANLIEAAAQVAAQNLPFHLYLGGDGPLRDELQSRISRLQLSRQVTLLGLVPQAQLAQAYAASDAFVIPTQALECFGLIAVEALSAGVPVLATTAGALGEIIRPVEPEWMMQPDPASIAQKVSQFLRAELPFHDAHSLREYAVSRYSLQTARRAFVDHLLDTVPLPTSAPAS